MNNKSGYELTCFVADEINSGFSYPDTLLHADPNPFCIANSILESGWILVEKEIGNPFCLLHIPVCYLFICLSKKMWII